jgi:hypothetical protein
MRMRPSASPETSVLRSTLIASALAAALVQAPAAAGPAGGFGRLQDTARSCLINLAAAPQRPCAALQFDQQLEGLLSIRFMAPGGGGEARDQLTFVGVLDQASTPLLCEQGRCRLQGPVRTQISSVSESSFDGRGVATGLPKAWPARGTCSVEQRQVRCQARALSGETWSAAAEF